MTNMNGMSSVEGPKKDGAINLTEGTNNIVGSIEKQFGGDPEIIAEVEEMKKQKNIFDSISIASIIAILNNPERKEKFANHLKNLQGKLEKLGKYWPVLAGAAITLGVLIASFVMDAGTPENSKIDASEVLAGLSVPFGFITALINEYIKKEEKGGVSDTLQHA